MRNVSFVFFILLSFAACVAVAAPNVETTMTVARCQAVLKDGSQCKLPAESGKPYCRQHAGAAKPADRTRDGSPSPHTWTTNAWESTKSGANRAWESTRDAFDEAGREFIKFFGGEKRPVKKGAK